MENEANSPSSICLQNSEWLAENIEGLDHRLLTPDKNLSMQIVESQVVGSDLSQSSGGGISDTTPVEGSESSLLSSDSDSESYNSSPCESLNLLLSGKMLKHKIVKLGTEISEMGGVVALTDQGGKYEMLMKLSDYEKELKVSREKLLSAEEDVAKLRNELLKNEELLIKMGSMEAQLVSAENQIKCYEADIEKENEKSLMLQWQVVDLETKLESEKRQVDELQESVKKYAAELSDRDLVIQKLNADLQDASGSFALEKWQLETSVSKLSECLTYHEGRTNELQKQCESLEAEKIETARNQEALQIIWQDNLECVKTEKNSLVDTLNKNLDKLKQNYNILMAEKDGVDAKLQTLNTDLSVGKDQIQRLGRSLLELQSENEQLRAGSDSSNKVTSELKSRILELEKELGMQAVMITDTAEGKREAIRQLCFSLDHFRSAYQQLREEYGFRKRPAAMAS